LGVSKEKTYECDCCGLTFEHLRLLHLFLQVLELRGLLHVHGALDLLEVLHVDLVLILLPLVREDLVGGWYSSVHFRLQKIIWSLFGIL